MVHWATRDGELLRDANRVLGACGWDFGHSAGEQGITAFRVRRIFRDPGFSAISFGEWVEWPADEGVFDLADMVVGTLGIDIERMR